MKLVIADPGLRQTVGATVSWYGYVVPEMQNFWINPFVYSHAEHQEQTQLPLVRSEYGQVTPERLKVERLFRSDSRDFFAGADSADLINRFTPAFEQALEDFQKITEIGPGGCIFVRGVGLLHAWAAISWLTHFPEPDRPKMILDLSEADLPGSAAGIPLEHFAFLYQELKHILGTNLLPSLKVITSYQTEAAYLEGALAYPVECWPNPQSVKPDHVDRRGQSPGKLIAVVGIQSNEKGMQMLPELASNLLKNHPDAAVLIHHAPGAASLECVSELLDLESGNPHLVVITNALPHAAWNDTLAAIDLAILPYNSTAYRNRHSWLLDELVANGVPALVPANTRLASRMEQFGLAGCTFEQDTPSSICESAARILARNEASAQQAVAARKLWAQSEGPKRLVANILSWFPNERKAWQGWSKSSQQIVAAGSRYRSKRVLLSWALDSAFIPPPQFSDNQVTVGPHPLATGKNFLLPNHRRIYDAYTPFFHTYDLKEILEIQGISGPFDVVIVATESMFSNAPLNLESFGCPVVLFAADTHWGRDALTRVLSYSAAARFDYVVTTYNRQHMHWYQEAGHERVAWIPGMAIEHHPQSFQHRKEKRIAFSGQSWKVSHERRARLLGTLKKSGLPFDPKGRSRAEAAALYNSSLISFNASMNGDLNLRIFEVLSAGGCLLTDRLTPESGQSLLFEEGRDFLAYSTEAELLETVRRCAADPEMVARIALSGNKTYTENLLPEQQTDALMDWVFSGELKPQYRSDWDPRPRIASFDSYEFDDRLEIYQRLQEAHRSRETLRVLVGPGVPLCIIADMIDLPRVDCHVLEGEQTVKPVLRQYGLETRVKYFESPKQARSNGSWDFLILADDQRRAAAEVSYKHLVIAKRSEVGGNKKVTGLEVVRT